MSKPFDIGLDALRARSNTALQDSIGAQASGALEARHAAPVVEAAPIAISEAVRPKSFYIETFGCQMNVHDSEKVAGVLLGRGYRAARNPVDADLLLFNTCSIREKAAQKVFSRLGDQKPSANGGSKVIGVLGCVAQQEGEEIFERAPWVSLVCGSASYRKLPELVEQLESGGRRVMGLDLDTDETFETEITRRDNPFRAYLTIIEGCDYSCAYCVVPHTRGPERSRASESVLSEVRRLADSGYTEIQLLGQTVNSYSDPSARGMNFVELLRAVASVRGIRRVRFTTSHPNDFHREIVEAIDEIPALCDHVHLPVQSGSTCVLKSMFRTYTRDEYLEKISWIRAAKRPISVTSDIIVGFPGETEKDFEDTVTLLDEVGYDGVFSFKYSSRPNTPAVSMEDAVPEEEKGRRLAILQDRQWQIQIERNQKLIGETFEVLVDARHASRGQWAGRSTSNRVLNFTSRHENILGQYAQVRVTRAGPNSLVGEHVEPS
ncbi:MAG TPA: tRNA (N6-isopentenyl adenosine(37)-C2)-methylthiotransferase MiaB [Candidatus Acidoferrum sp.]|nr:tRNA (N6-isopentenyl adenosine(37)-C2)-methylthiotransferase MiaB [Candidatus Acidoferrum sp.]